VARRKDPIELRKLSEDINPRLREFLAELTDDANSDRPRLAAKRTWGRSFKASGKTEAPRIQLSYEK
jgi:hypothetical protein